MTVKELMNMCKNGIVIGHRSSWCKGYVSRKPNADGTFGYVEKYNGKFGVGYKYYQPTTKSTRFSIVTYYIIK